MEAIGFHSHNHDECIKSGVERAARACAQAKLQFTPVRQRVLEILLSQHKALGAYEVLDVLRQEGLGSQPPVAYRALDFLVKNGFAHRIERLNAFIACTEMDTAHSPAFLICRSCDAVAEAPFDPKDAQLGPSAEAAGFNVERTVVEAVGLCPSCQDGPNS